MAMTLSDTVMKHVTDVLTFPYIHINKTLSCCCESRSFCISWPYSYRLLSVMSV